MHSDHEHVAAGPDQTGDVELLHQPAAGGDPDLLAVQPDPVERLGAVEAQQETLDIPVRQVEGAPVVAGRVLVRHVRRVDRETGTGCWCRSAGRTRRPGGSTQCDGTTMVAQSPSSKSTAAGPSSRPRTVADQRNRHSPFRLSCGASLSTHARGRPRRPRSGKNSSRYAVTLAP